jgi:tRNA-2-methylthio-N6-dimethylallyladenosine synthase
MKYFIKTFGCQQNIADSEQIANYYQNKKYRLAKDYHDADVIVVNTCSIRQKAEDKVFGLIRNLVNLKKIKNHTLIITGCMAGVAYYDQTGKKMKLLRRRLPGVDRILPIQFFISKKASQKSIGKKHAWVLISNGCNNFCSYCIVPLARGREVSRPFQSIIKEVNRLANTGHSEITLLGQNVNSYGSDLVAHAKKYILPNKKIVIPVFVRHLGKRRIPTLFPYLLEYICQNKIIRKIAFISSNPWDFSDQLISAIEKNKQIDRFIHLPAQSGSNRILKKMNRFYTKQQFLTLINKIRHHIPEMKFTTDIIVGFPGETKRDFQATVDLVKKAKFCKAFIAMYSPRPGTMAATKYTDDVPLAEKKRRFKKLDQLINHQYIGYLPPWLKPEL